MEITQYIIDLAMGSSNDWAKVPGINDQNVKELNIVGYTGRLAGEEMSLYRYLSILSKLNGYSYGLALLKGDNGDFRERYMVSVAVSKPTEKSYSKEDILNAYTQGVKDYCKSSLSLDSFLKEELPKWSKENL